MMSNQNPPSQHIVGADLLKRILLTSARPMASVIGDGANYVTLSDRTHGAANSPNVGGKVLRPTAMEDALLTAAAYGQMLDAGRSQHYEAVAPSSAVTFEQDSNMEDYSMDDLSPQGLNGSGDDPMLTIGMDQDSSGTNEHSNSDPIQNSETCFSVSQVPQDKVHKKKGRPAKGSATSGHGRLGVRCPVCNKTFNNSSALAKHKLTHSDERKYVCSTCCKTFKRQDHLNGHILTHSTKKPFECKFKDCGKSYCDARSLKRHLEHHHALDGTSGQTIPVPPYDPSAYGQQLVSQSNPLTASYPEQFSPVSSTSGSSNGASDKAHSAVAWPTTFSAMEDPLPHKCELCGRCFKNLPALNGHMRLHGGYFKKDDGADESPGWASDFMKKKLTTATTPATIAIPGASTKNATNFGDVRQIQPEHSSLVMGLTSAALGMTSAALTDTVARLQHTLAMNIDFAAESSISSSGAVSSLLEETGAMTSSSSSQPPPPPPAETMRIPNLGQHRVQVVSMSPFAAPALSLGSINSMDELLKLQEQRRGNALRSREALTYLSSDQLAAIIGDAKGISIAKDSLVPGSLFSQQLFHIASLPLSKPSLLTPKSDVSSAIGSDEDLRSVDQKPLLTHAWKTDGYRHGMDVGKELKVERMEEKREEPDREALSERDETMSTDSAKDSDQEDVSTLDLKEAMYRSERRRWASADADQFTSSIKTLLKGRSPARPGFTVPVDHQLLRGCASGFLRQYFDGLEGEGAAGDEPPVIDDVRHLNMADCDRSEFRSPNATLLKFRRKNRPEPLIIPPQTSIGFAYHSRLRSPRITAKCSFDTKPLPFTPYTPPPMLSPIRNGSGLFCQLSSKSPVSAPVALRTGQTPRRNSRGSVLFPPFPAPEPIVEEEEQQLVEELEEEVVALDVPTLEPPPETDISPHVNVGPDYQAEIPAFNSKRSDALECPSKEEMVWDPSTMLNVRESEVRSFMDFACSAAVPFNGSNKEYAHHLLNLCSGNIKKAILKLMQQNLRLAPGHALHSYIYQEADVWNSKEIEAFQDGMTKFDKDFFRVAQHVGTKSVQKCVQFYYMWKKVSTEEHKRLRIVRRKREQDNLYNLRSTKTTETQMEGIEKDDLAKGFPSVDGLRLPFSGYVASDGSLGGEPEDNIIAEADLPFSSFHDIACDLQYEETVETEEYPCKICGKVFSKVKSRSAHMKTHRPMGNGPSQTQVTDRGRLTTPYGPQDS